MDGYKHTGPVSDNGFVDTTLEVNAGNHNP